jgi:hypothetical protein
MQTSWGIVANSIAEKLLELESYSSGGYVLLANTYAAEGQWDEFAQVRKRMREMNVKKIPGYSQIQVNGKNHTFFVWLVVQIVETKSSTSDEGNVF